MITIAFHSLLFFPGWAAQPASVDVQRGPVSFEVELFSEAQATPPAATPQAPAPPTESELWSLQDAAPPVRPHPPIDAAAGHGAFIRMPSHGGRNRPPTYPWLARLRGQEGTVILRVRVERDGRPSAVRVLHSSGYPILDEAARRAIHAWEFLPAHHGGLAVSSEAELPVRFRLTAPIAETP